MALFIQPIAKCPPEAIDWLKTKLQGRSSFSGLVSTREVGVRSETRNADLPPVKEGHFMIFTDEKHIDAHVFWNDGQKIYKASTYIELLK